ncbi:MAG: ribonuclease inhibitor [Bacteroidetes bacterium]|nr:ribonuclease inhibitor [Bacteroidota bacterium]MCY4233789.1 ribonuclease inhibitor [Bacteroidota bacterium]
MNQSVVWLCVGLGLTVIMLVMVPGSGRPTDFTLFLGRFHPLVVHLPIGILMVAALLELLSRLPSLRGRYDSAIQVLLYVGVWSSMMAVAAGLYLAQSGGYAAEQLMWHKRMGILLVLLASLAYLYKAWPALSERWRKPWESGVYGVTVGFMLVSLTFTGHFGGVLTHGSDYLTRYLPDPIRLAAGLPKKADIGRLQLEDPSSTSVYAALISPILESRCVACHNSAVQRGGLRLDEPEFINEGGDSGPVVVSGLSDESELIKRIWLPANSNDRMPPAESPQLTIAEAELLRWWIDAGASFEDLLPDAEWSLSTQTIVDYMGLGDIRTGIFALDTAPPDSMDITALVSLGLSVTLLGENEPYLQVRCVNLEACTGGNELSEALRRLSPNIAWLDLGRSQVGDELMEVIAALPHLTRLHLQQTMVTDAGMTHLSELNYLEYLNLYGTSITDSALVHFEELPALRSLYLWQTLITDDGVARLQATAPELYINTGLSLMPVEADSLES